MADAEIIRLDTYRQPSQEQAENLPAPGAVLDATERLARTARRLLALEDDPTPVTLEFGGNLAKVIHDLAEAHGLLPEELVEYATHRGIESIQLEDEGYTVECSKPQHLPTPWGVDVPLPPDVRVFRPLAEMQRTRLRLVPPPDESTP